MSQVPSVWIAAVTVETAAPLSIGTGAGDDLRDAICVTDANDLPTIPGTSIAGVLRHAWDELHGVDSSDALFGHIKGKGHTTSERSRLSVSWAAVHDQQNRPVTPFPGEVQADDVLQFLGTGVTRDHVRLNHLGVADGAGKFDVTAVPVGARFSFELRIDGPRSGEVESLLRILGSGQLRFGGQTRRGFGRVKVLAARAKTFEWRVPADLAAWRHWAAAIDFATRAATLKDLRLPEGSPAGTLWTLVLTSEAAWRVGGGSPSDADVTETAAWSGMPRTRSVSKKAVDLAPLRECRILWKDGRASISGPTPILPGTAIKGAIRHRTAFHKRRANGDFTASPGGPDGDGLDRLFGDVKGTQGGQAGSVYIDDVWVDSSDRVVQEHVAIDRFSGAPVNGALFSESMLGRTNLTIQVWASGQDHADLSALRAALNDLAEGRLALGAASSRGHGFFVGSVVEKKC